MSGISFFVLVVRTTVVFDLRRVPGLTIAAARLLATLFAELAAHEVRIVLSSVENGSAVDRLLETAQQSEHQPKIRRFPSLEEAAGWAEDQAIFIHGGFNTLTEPVELADTGLRAIAELCSVCRFRSGESIVTAGEPGDSLYFIQRGMTSVMLTSGTRVATLGAGTCFGELVPLAPGTPPSAHVGADSATTCLRLSLEDYHRLRSQHPIPRNGYWSIWPPSSPSVYVKRTPKWKYCRAAGRRVVKQRAPMRARSSAE